MKKLLVVGALLLTIPTTTYAQTGTGRVMTEDSQSAGAENTTSTLPETGPQKTTPVLDGNSSFSVQYKAEKTFSLNVTTTGTAGLTYTTSNPSVAKVSAKGVVTLKGIGQCVITVVSPENSNYLSTSKSIRISSWKRAKSIGYSASYKKGKFYKNLRSLKLFNNKRDNLIAIANSQVGYRESSSSKVLTGAKKGSRNYTEFGRFYGYNGVPWCAIFVNWVARETGLSYSVVPKRCAVRDYYSFFRRKGLAHPWSQVRTAKYKPKKGDIIFYSYSYGATTHHIGYVDSCEYASNKLTLKVIEGNAKDAVRRVTMTLKKSNTRGKIRGYYITGIASPRY